MSSLPTRAKLRKWAAKNLLLILTVLGVIAGVGGGFACRPMEPTQRTIDLIGFPGEIFMSMLKMLIIPLIAASLISGLSQLDAKQSGQIGAYAFLFYGITMTLAVMTGIILVLIIHPGDPSIKKEAGVESSAAANVSALEKALDLVRNMFPDNIVRATFQQVDTEYVEKHYRSPQSNRSKAVIKSVHSYVDGMNVLGLIIFFITMGLTMGSLGEKVKPLADLFLSLDLVITSIVGVIMWYSPVGIASLIAAKILEINDMGKTVRMLAVYVMTVVLGLLIQCFVTLPTVLYAASRKNPFEFMKGMTQAVLTALGTASSAASLPVTFRCLEETNGVDPKYTKFVLPVGAMINMDGTALYEAVASIFIAQMNGLEMGIGTVLTISVTATLASIGAASIPSAGLVTMLVLFPLYYTRTQTFKTCSFAARTHGGRLARLGCVANLRSRLAAGPATDGCECDGRWLRMRLCPGDGGEATWRTCGGGMWRPTTRERDSDNG